MRKLNEGANRPKTQDGEYKKHRNKPERKRLSKIRRREGKKDAEENAEYTSPEWIMKDLRDLRFAAPEEFEDYFKTSDLEEAYKKLEVYAERAGIDIASKYQDVRDKIQPRDDFYPEGFDTAVNSILKGLQDDVIEEALPAIVGVVARKAGPPIVSHLAKKGIDKLFDGGEEESYCENEEDGPSKIERLQNYIDDNYPNLIAADRWVEDGIDTPAKLDYNLALADYSDTYKSYWGSRPRNIRDRIEEDRWDDDDYLKAAERLTDQADEYREKLREQSPEYRAKKERELLDKHRHRPDSGGSSLRDILDSISREENEG